MFQFNPDTHVRSAYKPCPEDPQRKEVLETPAAKLAIQHRSATDPGFAEKMRQHNNIEKVKKSGGQRKRRNRRKKANKILTTNEPDSTVTDNVTEMIPPQDTFHRINHYYEANYDALREAVKVLYCEKPDLETAVNPYQWHDSRDDADDFINKHKNEVIAPIFPAHSGKWNFIGPFKKVRESVRYYNDNTIVLEEIMKQRESDEKLGKDLLKKRIKKKKADNIDKAGPDDPAFLAWSKQHDPIKDMGGDPINRESMASDECPDDAVQIDVFRTSAVKRTMKVDHIFTAAEAPQKI
jgi:hypothetical protein